MTRFTFRPQTPPLAFCCFQYSWVARTIGFPSAANVPERSVRMPRLSVLAVTPGPAFTSPCSPPDSDLPQAARAPKHMLAISAATVTLSNRGLIVDLLSLRRRNGCGRGGRPSTQPLRPPAPKAGEPAGLEDEDCHHRGAVEDARGLGGLERAAWSRDQGERAAVVVEQLRQNGHEHGPDHRSSDRAQPAEHDHREEVDRQREVERVRDDPAEDERKQHPGEA